MTSTLSLTITNSTAISSKRSLRPSAQRYSITKFCASIQPSSRNRRTKGIVHGASFMHYDVGYFTSTWSRRPCNPSTTRSARGCHPCLGYVLSPMCPGWTLTNWSGRRDSNPRPRPWQGRALPLSYTRIRWAAAVSPPQAVPIANSGGALQPRPKLANFGPWPRRPTSCSLR
jgi:hypothetical protein